MGGARALIEVAGEVDWPGVLARDPRSLDEALFRSYWLPDGLAEAVMAGDDLIARGYLAGNVRQRKARPELVERLAATWEPQVARMVVLAGQERTVRFWEVWTVPRLRTLFSGAGAGWDEVYAALLGCREQWLLQAAVGCPSGDVARHVLRTVGARLTAAEQLRALLTVYQNDGPDAARACLSIEGLRPEAVTVALPELEVAVARAEGTVHDVGGQGTGGADPPGGTGGRRSGRHRQPDAHAPLDRCQRGACAERLHARLPGRPASYGRRRVGSCHTGLVLRANGRRGFVCGARLPVLDRVGGGPRRPPRRRGGVGGTDQPRRAVQAKPHELHTVADVIVELALGELPELDRWVRGLAELLAAGPDLVKTLNAFYQHDMNRLGAAKALNIHPRTLDYRIHRARELMGLHPASVRGVRVISTAHAYALRSPTAG